MSAANVAQLLDLSIPDRLDIVQRLWDSIVQEADSVPIPEFHLEEIRRRLDAYRQDPTAGSSWEEVKARIRSRK